MRMYKRIKNRGFTLVELMIVVAIIGVLAALAIYGVRKYLLNAKTAEAKEGIGRIAKDASSAFDREAMAAAVLDLKDSTGTIHRLCNDSSKVPTSAANIQGKKYQSDPGDWDGTADSGWHCLKFTMKDPQYFQYQYEATESGDLGSDGATFTAIAHGDLNGDTTLSTFTLGGKIQTGTTGGLVLTVAPNYQEVLPEE